MPLARRLRWRALTGRYARLLILGVTVFASSLLGNSLLAADSNAAEEAQDTHQSILAMLQAEMGETVIRAWLDRRENPPELPTAEQLIELKKAGASESLLTHLLEIAGSEPVAAPPSPQTPPATRSTSSASSSGAGASTAPSPEPLSREATTPTVTAPQSVSAPQAPAAPTPSLPRDNEDGVMVEFSFLYSPTFDDDEEEWGLYAYLDGHLLTYVPASGGFFGSGSKTLDFARRLPAGRHLLRLVQERHERRRGRWRHHARAAEEVLEIELQPVGRARVEVSFRQRSLNAFGNRKPLSFRFEQGEILQERRDVGSEPDSWPRLCEELEADAAGRKRPRPANLEGCVRWAGLWPGLEVPGRDEVRQQLADMDYRPVARQRLLADAP